MSSAIFRFYFKVSTCYWLTARLVVRKYVKCCLSLFTHYEIGCAAATAPVFTIEWFPRLDNSVVLGPAPATACYQPLLVTSSCVGKPFKRLNSHQDFLRSGKFYSSRRKISLFTENSIIWTGLFEKNDGETWSYWCLRRPINGILHDMSLNICSIFCWSNRWLNK